MKLDKRSHFRSSSSSVKFKLNCQDKLTNQDPTTYKWLSILKKIQTQILIGFLKERNANVIVKFDKPEEISKDYCISEKLYESKIPNFIKYYCMFSCNENMDRFDDTDLTDKSLCHDKGIKTGFIVMPYYDTGSVKNYSWDVSKFKSLKNVLCQAVLALCSSYVSIGFVHGDMHLDNIVLRKTEKKTLLYKEFEIIFKPEEFYAIILDFGRSNTRGNFDEFISSIWTMICLTRDIGKKTSIILDTTGVSNHIRTMKKINKSSVAGLLDKINSMKIDYVKRA